MEKDNYNRENKTLITWKELETFRNETWILEITEAVNNRVMILLEKWQNIGTEFTPSKISVPEWTKVTFIAPDTLSSPKINVDFWGKNIDSKTFWAWLHAKINNTVWLSYNKNTLYAHNSNVQGDAINRNIWFWASNEDIWWNAINHHIGTKIWKFSWVTPYNQAINKNVQGNALNVDSRWAASNYNVQGDAINRDIQYTAENTNIQGNATSVNVSKDSLHQFVSGVSTHENIWWDATDVWNDGKSVHKNISWKSRINGRNATGWRKLLPSFLREQAPFKWHWDTVDKWSTIWLNYPWR